MNILYVVHDFFPEFYGGTERYLLNLAKQIQRMGNSVTVLTYGIADTPDMFTQNGNILHRTYSYEGIPVICIRHKKVPPDHGYRISDDLLEDMVRILANEEIDVMHVAHPMRVSAAITAARQLHIPVVLTITDFWLICARGRFFKPDYSLCNSAEEGQKCRQQCGVDDSIFERYRSARKIFDTVDARIAPSGFLIEVFRTNGWDRPIRLVNHGIDYTHVKPRHKSRRPGAPLTFAYMGVVGKFKGIDLLLDSFRKVDDQNIRLNIYGNCIGDDGTIDIVHDAEKNDKRIRAMGRFDHKELPDILDNIDIMVVPSTTLESFGLVVTESLSYGVPVIASDIVGSAYDFIEHNSNGMIFSVKDPDGLERIIREISADPSIVERLRSNISPPPRLEEEAFTIEKVYKSFSS